MVQLLAKGPEAASAKSKRELQMTKPIFPPLICCQENMEGDRKLYKSSLLETSWQNSLLSFYCVLARVTRIEIDPIHDVYDL